MRGLERSPQQTHAPGGKVDLIVSGRAGDDAVELLRVTLRGHQALPSTGGTAFPVRQAWAMSIIGRHQCFGLHSGFVNRAIGKVDDLLGMAEGEPATAAAVTGVGGRAGITLANSVRQSCGVDAADQTASTLQEEFTVPHGGRGQPDFGLAVRIGRWSEREGNPTVSGGLCGGGDVRQARHLSTRDLGEERDGEKEEQTHAYQLIRSGAPPVRASHVGHRNPLSRGILSESQANRRL